MYRGTRAALTTGCVLVALLGCALSDTDVPAADASVAAAPSEQARAADAPEKLRILVDKVMEPAVPPELAVQAAAEAGFNVFTLRRAGEDEATLRRLAQAAERHGIRTVGWMWGTRRAGEGLKLVAPSGEVAWVYSPNADELWSWYAEQVLMHARVSRDCPALIGSFLDMEVYDQLSVGWAYPVSYDEKILSEFASARGVRIPTLEPKERRKWLADNDLQKAFEDFQIDSWRQRCRELRRNVDAVNPKFQFWFYPGPGSRFIVEAAGPEWARPDAPMVFADVDTYGRPGWYIKQGRPMAQADALAANRKLLERDLAILKGVSFAWRYVGGIDPCVRGADPEFCFANAVMEADLTDGYWVFYEGPKYDRPDHEAYWDAFTRTNRAIASGDLEAWKRPRPVQDLYAGDKIAPATDRVQVGVYGLSDEAVQRLRESGRYEVHVIHDTSADYLKPLDVVIAQDYSYNMWDAKYLSAGLVEFARQGGGLLAAHDTLVQCDRLLPEVAKVARLAEGADRHGRLTEATVTVSDPELRVEKPFRTASPTVWPLRPGKAGRVVAADAAGHVACVVGPVEKGKAACYGARFAADAGETEWKLLLALIDYLAK